MLHTRAKVILAADGLSLPDCLELVPKCRHRIAAVKIHHLWDEHGPGVVQRLKDCGVAAVWVDLKLNDIPQTVARRAAAVKASGATMLTVMASGEVDMMKAAVEHGPAHIWQDPPF